MKKSLFLFLAFILPAIIMAQDKGKTFGIHFNGFVKTDMYWDSRQTVSIRDGQFYLYPMNESLDKDGKDINARPNFNFLSIQTRLHGDITGPDALGAKTSGAIEGEFFGMADGNINGFRLRHAYVKLNWTKTELLVGQYWNPMFTTASFPGVVNFNTGVPFMPFSRNPQIRLTQNFGGFKVYIAALSQLDFKSNGPKGASTMYIRNTATPAFNLNIEYSTKNEKGTSFLIGLAGAYKSLLPRMSTDSSYKTTTKVSSMSGMLYTKLVIPAMTFKITGFYGQDAYDYTMLGGYAVSSVTDIQKNFVEYTPIRTMSFWGDFNTNGKKLQVGLFLGYSKNLGASKDVTGPFYDRGYDKKNNDYIAYIYRISPRLIYNTGKFRIAPELDYTAAAYGKSADSKGIAQNTKEIGNFRFLVGVYYFF